MNHIIVGTGYVGLIQGLVLADSLKKPILFIEKDKAKMKKLVEDKLPHFYEPGLEKLFKKNYKFLKFAENIETSQFAKETVVFICVGTPQSESGEADLSYLKAAASEVIAHASGQTTLVVKSTVPPGTTQSLADSYRASTKTVHWAMNPEFLREGVAVEDGLNPDRIVLGTESALAVKSLKKVYQGFKKAEIVVCSPTEAELSKYAMNSLLALLISFSNEISQISSKLKKVNPHQILDIVKMDGRWKVNGKLPSIASYLVPGPGYGGSCFPKDVSALVSRSKQMGFDAKIMSHVIEVNQDMGKFASEQVYSLAPAKSKITLLGLAFKPDTDDIRESPTLRIIESLKRDYEICVHDPIAELPSHLQGQVELTRDLKKALANSSLAVVVTSWKDYHKLTDKTMAFMKSPVVLDTRGFLKKNPFKKTKYHLLGFNN